MKRLFCLAMAGFSLAVGAQTVALTSTSSGDITGTFVQQANGSFIDTFTFTPTSVAGKVSVSLSDINGPINFFTALLNGQGFAFLPEDGNTNFHFSTTVTADQPLQLQVSGFAGDASTLSGMDATYGGSFIISGIPEPADIALMLAGLAGIGMLARRRKTT